MICCVCWIGVVVAGIIAAFAAFLAYMGVFKKINVVKCQFGPALVVYTEYQGPFDKIQPVYKKTLSVAQSVFKNTKSGGFYYDNPYSLAKNELPRACVAVFV